MNAAWRARAYAALATLGVAACGLDSNGLDESDAGGPGSSDAAPDATLVATGDSSLPADDADGSAASADASIDSPVVIDGARDSSAASDAGQCADTATSCGPPGACVNCTSSPSGGACVSGACGCNGATDCPAPDACQTNHVCGPGCGTGQSSCNGGCCSFFSCVPFDNSHCGGSCSACAGQTPTCGPDGNCNGSCGGPGDGTCQTSCCNQGTCATVGNQSCGDFGATCVNCSGMASGSNCELIAFNYVCGCDGPGSSSQCPPGDACNNQQCATACDGQHPCNGGCCSGNDIGSSTCVPSCDGGAACPAGNFCQ